MGETKILTVDNEYWLENVHGARYMYQVTLLDGSDIFLNGANGVTARTQMGPKSIFFHSVPPRLAHRAQSKYLFSTLFTRGRDRSQSITRFTMCNVQCKK